jgi:hypothetical protein
MKTRAGGGGVDGDLLLDLRLHPLAITKNTFCSIKYILHIAND